MKKSKKPTYPVGAIVVQVHRFDFPGAFNPTTMYDEEREPFQNVDAYNLVVVPSGPISTELHRMVRFSHAFVYSAKSNRMYPWDKYYPDYNEDKLDVGGSLILVDCLTRLLLNGKSKTVVNVYASTAGVVWLALRACEPGDWSPGPVALSLVEMDDAPFSTYFDKIEESPGNVDTKDRLRAKLNLFFGLTPVEK